MKTSGPNHVSAHVAVSVAGPRCFVGFRGSQQGKAANLSLFFGGPLKKHSTSLPCKNDRRRSPHKPAWYAEGLALAPHVPEGQDAPGTHGK